MLLRHIKQYGTLVCCFLLWATGYVLIQMYLYTRVRKKRNVGTLLQIGNVWRYWLDRTSQGNGQGENATAVFCFEWRANQNVNI